tara:strand:+ start:160 stop:360 length:201 start_codon:yes stop_codon:yes gene_type:complete
VNVKEMISHLRTYPDDLEVRALADFGTGVVEIGLDNVTDSSEWDERDIPVVFLVEKDSVTYELISA